MVEANSMFVRVISHELRTPLNIVNIGLKLLKEIIINNKSQETSFETLETIEDVERSCEICVNILDDLVEYKNYEMGLFVIEKKKVSVASFLIETAAPFLVQVSMRLILPVLLYWYLY